MCIRDRTCVAVDMWNCGHLLKSGHFGSGLSRWGHSVGESFKGRAQITPRFFGGNSLKKVRKIVLKTKMKEGKNNKYWSVAPHICCLSIFFLLEMFITYADYNVQQNFGYLYAAKRDVSVKMVLPPRTQNVSDLYVQRRIFLTKTNLSREEVGRWPWARGNIF